MQKIYRGYPCGSFDTTGALVSPRNNYLVMYGKFPTPCFFDLNKSRPVQQSLNDKFSGLGDCDGIGFVELLRNIKDTKKMKNSCGAEVIDCCFLSEKQLAFIRADGLFQVSSIVGDVVEIELRDSLHDKP